MKKDAPTIDIEVFRPGTFRPLGGNAPLVFAKETLRDIARIYDADFADAPIVVGHPRTDDPAKGWVKSLEFNEQTNRLVAKVGDLDAAFADDVKSKRYKKISVRLFTPEHPANPKPGHYYLRHVGFLGAASPAVTGLKSVSFAGDDDQQSITLETMDFADMPQETQTLRARIMAWLADKFGADEAKSLMSDEEADKLFGEEVDSNVKTGKPAATIAPEEKPDTTEKTDEAPNGVDDGDAKKKGKKPDAAFAVLEKEKELAKREASIRERERVIAHDANVSFADNLIKEGKWLPVSRQALVGILDAIDIDAASISFSDGSDPAKSLREALMKQPPVVPLGDSVTKDGGLDKSVSFAAPDGYSVDPDRLALHAKAMARMRANPNLTYIEAAAAIERGE